MAVKLVRGAYLNSEIRELIHDTKADTDACYDGIVQDVMRGSLPGRPMTPYDRRPLELFLAGHNAESVRSASALAQELSAKNALKAIPEFGQLQGMADDLGCELLKQADVNSEKSQQLFKPKVYKYLTWGRVKECMEYLVRRAVENKAAKDKVLGTGVILNELTRRFWTRLWG